MRTARGPAKAQMRSWIEVLARTGYAARGVVYLIVGVFAVLAAFGRSETTGTEGAFRSILAQPFGTVLVWIVALGLLAHCAWRLVQAVRDTDHHGHDGKGLAVRAGLIAGGLSYAALALFAIGLARGTRNAAEGGGETDPSSRWLAAIHELGIGRLVVLVIAAVVFAVGIAHIAKGWRAGFMKYFRCPADVMRWLKPLAQSGLIARGVTFLIISALIVSGSLAYNAERQPGLAEALEAVQGYAFGWLILLAIGLGLIAFALYSLAEARYRHIDPR